jgi:8-oxo-dGTP diphosphatase
LADPAIDFTGAKIALLQDGHVLTYLRDDFAHLPWPGYWDLPGGGREGDEAPLDCALRELAEEFGLTYAPTRVIWTRAYPDWKTPARAAWFFGGGLTPADLAGIRFGDEGQGWQMMPIADFLHHPRAVPFLQARLADWLQNAPGQG